MLTWLRGQRVNKKLLSLTILIGIALHAAAIFSIHRHPIKYSGHSLKKEELLTDFFREPFQEIILPQKEKIEVKQEFHELSAEYAPSLKLALPTPYLELESEPFAFEPDLKAPSSLDGEVLLIEGSRLLSKAPLITSIEMPPLATIDYPDDPLDNFGTLASSEHFDIEVEYAPKRSRPGYVFKVTFLPRPDVVFKRIRQNLFFLIDRSNSIPRSRYAYNKRAVFEALEHLHPGDTFNILIFDDSVVSMAPQPLPWNSENVSQARAFLESQGHGGYLAATDLYSSLGRIIPHDVSDHEVNTALLLSDGDTFLSRERQRLMIAEWTQRNQGKVSLYSLASGSGNNLPLLELISSFNQGNLLYTQDHRELKTLIFDLLGRIQNPIGKKMVATAVTLDKQTTILLQPKAVRLPDLFQNRPFVIYGSTNRLSDFVLFLQGKYYDQGFDIKKNISFREAKMGTFAIERKWTGLLAHEYYAHYFQDGKISHLEAAKQLLHPLNISTPWIE